MLVGRNTCSVTATQVFKNYILVYFVCGKAQTFHDTPVEVREQLFGIWFSPSTVWVPGIKLKPPGWAPSTFTHQAPVFGILNVVLFLNSLILS